MLIKNAIKLALIKIFNDWAETGLRIMALKSTKETSINVITAMYSRMKMK
jgi:hypothetical protein